MPVLIKHLDDQRVTRIVLQGFNNFPTYRRRVGAVVSDLLQDLAGNEMGIDWLRRQQGYAVSKARAIAWWKNAKKSDEESYFRNFATKYSRQLASLDSKVLNSLKLKSWLITEKIVKSAPSNREETDRPLEAAQSDITNHMIGLNECDVPFCKIEAIDIEVNEEDHSDESSLKDALRDAEVLKIKWELKRQRSGVETYD